MRNTLAALSLVALSGCVDESSLGNESADVSSAVDGGVDLGDRSILERCIDDDPNLQNGLDYVLETIVAIRADFAGKGGKFTSGVTGCFGLDVPCSDTIVVTDNIADANKVTSIGLATDGAINGLFCDGENSKHVIFQPADGLTSDDHGTCGFLYYQTGPGVCDDTKGVYGGFDIEVLCPPEDKVNVSDGLGAVEYEKITPSEARSLISCMKGRLLVVFNEFKK